MAAWNTLPQFRSVSKSGVLVLDGFGIRVQVKAGHLFINDGIADERRMFRLPRAGHGLRRLVIIGKDGFVSLEALRWLADQQAALTLLERDGSVLAIAGPVCPSDSRLRRAQALAHNSGLALQIAKELIGQKLLAQQKLVSEKFRNGVAVHAIASAASSLANAGTIDLVRQFESLGAQAYWSAWRHLKIPFPTNDLSSVPDHWRFFGARQSLLTNSPRLAINPLNAMLNYVYAIVESEARLAAVALGLDPGIGILHVDTDSRDSLACDLMEPIRPHVDAYLLDWITKGALRREWFSEQRDGTCRLKSSLAERLSETANVWQRAIGPVAEMVCRMLWKKRVRDQSHPPTPLTQRRRREAKGQTIDPSIHPPNPPKVCKTCGKQMTRGTDYCAACSVEVSTHILVEAAKAGRVAGHTEQALLRQAETLRRQHAARREWSKSAATPSLDEQTYRHDILPFLNKVSAPAISAALSVSRQYAIQIRRGERIPHPMHWSTLASLVDLSKPGS